MSTVDSSCGTLSSSDRGYLVSKNRSIEAIATDFVNLSDNAAVREFIYKHRLSLPLFHSDLTRHPKYYAKFAKKYGVAWESPPALPNGEPTPIQVDRAKARTVHNTKTAMRHIEAWSLGLRKAWDERESKLAEHALEIILSARYGEPAAFQIHLGQEQPVFKRRDLFDRIAYAILKASERGLLRTCRGHKQDWPCPTPYLVADEKRRVYCYSNCGDEAKRRAKLKWWKKNRSPKRHQRAA